MTHDIVSNKTTFVNAFIPFAPQREQEQQFNIFSYAIYWP